MYFMPEVNLLQSKLDDLDAALELYETILSLSCNFSAISTAIENTIYMRKFFDLKGSWRSLRKAVQTSISERMNSITEEQNLMSFSDLLCS